MDIFKVKNGIDMSTCFLLFFVRLFTDMKGKVGEHLLMGSLSCT